MTTTGLVLGWGAGVVLDFLFFLYVLPRVLKKWRR